MADRPLDYSTKIDAERTAQECVKLLGRAGADEVSIKMDSGDPVGLGFLLETPHGKRRFILPLHRDDMAKALAVMLDRNPPHVSTAEMRRLRSDAQALRVAWRVARDWLTASLALLEARQANLDEVMLPYLEVTGAGGELMTLYAHYRQQERAALESRPA